MNLTKPTLNRSFVIDLAGNSWSWNCGWAIIGQDGTATNMTKLGHATFNRSIPRATREDIKSRLGPRSRPNGIWRRVLDIPYEHRHTGKIGKVMATDGVHAIFLTNNEHGEKVKIEVMFNNLNEAKPSQKLPTDSRAKVTTTKRKNKTTKHTLDSLGIDLNDLLS